jgi:hypothetical protein
LRGDGSNYEDERTIGGSRKAPALPLPTPEGSHPQQLTRYRSQVLAYINIKKGAIKKMNAINKRLP